MMDKSRIAKMSDKIAKEKTEDEALSNVDQAIDTIIASIMVMEENLPKVKTGNVPEKAAVDAVQDLLDTAIKPYFADAVKAMQIFGE